MPPVRNPVINSTPACPRRKKGIFISFRIHISHGVRSGGRDDVSHRAGEMGEDSSAATAEIMGLFFDICDAQLAEQFDLSISDAHLLEAGGKTVTGSARGGTCG